MKNKLLKIKEGILKKVKEIKNSDELQKIEEQYLGRKSEFNAILKNIKELSPEIKKEIGALANSIKEELINEINELKGKINVSTKKEFIDPSLPGERTEKGHLHPITVVQEEIEELFSSMGFKILDGPELESDYYNFTALNFSKHHPAREMQDTFFIDMKNEDGENDILMRTHTSPMQIRAMKKYGAPLKALIPGKCFRNEATDARHEHTFYHVEGIMIDKNINFSNLKGVLEMIGKKLYGPKTKLRMRPKHYPFVEPGSNGEYTCFLCQGKGCRVCKNSGWLEILGCGMIHPEVLRKGGIDPNEYSGFAFGLGLDRLVMLKYNINDVRLFNSGDLQFLNQF
ncbi:MAG: phenylalanine--tRNA ligase subunit alpha [Patescibacteria group bacterium]|jgi:phenylalanyl-tRNA synthetase alpha chain